MKKKIITVGGSSASGTTTVTEILLDYFPNYTFHSTGAMARKMAKDNDMSLEEYVVYARENDIPYDSLLDESLKAIGETEDCCIIDSRLAYLFIKDSFKVLLKIDLDVAAQRRFDQLKKKDPVKYAELTLEQVKAEIVARDLHDKNRFLELYDTDYTDEENYDLVIDTSREKVTQYVAAGQIIVEYQGYMRDNDLHESR